MRISRKLIMLVVTFSIFLCAGCSGIPIRVNEIDREFDRSKIDFTKPRYLEASKSGFQLLLFIPIGINDRQLQAYQMIRAQAGGDFITDVKVKESWTYAFVGTVYTTTLQAVSYPRK